MTRTLPLVALCLLISCTPEAIPTSTPLATLQLKESEDTIVRTCHEGCLDPDPDTTAPGYFMPGTSISFAGCTANGVPDSDHDGLSNGCEANLAATFTPELVTLNGDPTDRESRWAAKVWDDNTVRVVYLLGYYLDAGDGGFSRGMCDFTNYFPPFGFLVGVYNWFAGLIGNEPGDLTSCRGHLGDSEWIALDLEYTPSLKHWRVAHALYSAHTGANDYDGSELQWVDRIGGRPRSWVADGKHANYRSGATCQAGGTHSSDGCQDVNNRLHQIVNASPTGNIGSVTTPLIDCVVSTNPERAGNGRYECYWTPQEFRGWFPNGSSGGSAEAYSTILGRLGFYTL